MFHNLVYSGKIFLVIALVTLSFINGHNDFVEKNPRSFMVGCLGFAMIMSLSSAFLAANRHGAWGSAAFITFLFFFFYAVTREFSGYYALMSGGKEATQNEGKERKLLIPIGIVIVLIGLIGGGFLVNKIRMPPPAPADMKFVRFPVELILFVVIGTAAETLVSRQHGDKSVLGIGLSVLIYIIAHFYLQYGGFYDHSFAPINFEALNNLKAA